MMIRSVAFPALTVCLGTALGLLRRPAAAKLLLCSRTLPVLAPPFRSPRKPASCLGSRAHSLSVARDKTGRTGETYVPQQNHPYWFIGSDAERKAANATNIAIFSLATKTSWKNDAG